MKSRFYIFGLIIMAASMLLTACQPSAPATSAPQPSQPTTAPAQATAPASAPVTLRYMLWVDTQQAAYQACADNFTKKNPNIKIKIEQIGWTDYWTTLQTDVVSGNAADVAFMNFSFYPDFAKKNQLLDIQPYVNRDKIDLSVYAKGLEDRWVFQGKRYALPKDWDSIAVVYSKDMLDKSGVKLDDLNSATWNPKDGGTFQQIIAKLTLDSNGKNGLDPAFDKTKVVQYGIAIDNIGNSHGNTSWGSFGASNGWAQADAAWATKYNWDDPKFIDTITNMYSWIEKGYAPKYADVASLDARSNFTAKKAAMVLDGSWMISWYASNVNFPYGYAMMPKGPNGYATVFNGLGDVIYAGTKHPEEAWQWVKYLGSAECQNTVGSFGVVFPAIQSGTDAALNAYKTKGIDVAAYTNIAKNGTHLMLPMTEHLTEIDPIMKNALESVFLGQKPAADALKEANAQVNALFK